MKPHYSKQVWMDYARGQLMEEDRSGIEAHLYDCDACLQLYMECMSQEVELLSDENNLGQAAEEWTDQIMETILIQKKKSRIHPRHAKTPLYQRSWLQFTVAAAITLILMAAGLFQGVMSPSNKIQAEPRQAHESSYTDQLMDKTVMLLDTIQPKLGIKVKGGGKNE
jgi:anti-sigma factor RsiW